MIPEQFKVNTLLKVNIFGHEVDVNYAYYWPRIKEEQLKLKDEGPLVSHIDFALILKLSVKLAIVHISFTVPSWKIPPMKQFSSL